MNSILLHRTVVDALETKPFLQMEITVFITWNSIYSFTSALNQMRREIRNDENVFQYLQQKYSTTFLTPEVCINAHLWAVSHVLCTYQEGHNFICIQINDKKYYICISNIMANNHFKITTSPAIVAVNGIVYQLSVCWVISQKQFMVITFSILISSLLSHEFDSTQNNGIFFEKKKSKECTTESTRNFFAKYSAFRLSVARSRAAGDGNR